MDYFGVKHLKEFGHGHYLVGEDSLTYTDILSIATAPNNFGGTVTVKISRSMNEKLFQEVLALENAAANTVRALDEEKLKQLPVDISSLIRKRRNDPTWQCLRPNYCNKDEHAADPTVYLKGNVSAIGVFDFAGSFLPMHCLGTGLYQFAIRTNMVYMGAHKEEYHVANLQIRIAQLRYTPGPVNLNPHMVALNSVVVHDPQQRQPLVALPIEEPQPTQQQQQPLANLNAIQLPPLDTFMEVTETKMGADATVLPTIDVLLQNMGSDNKENMNLERVPTTPANLTNAPPTPLKKVAKKKKTLANETPKKPTLKRQNALVNLEGYFADPNGDVEAQICYAAPTQ